MATPLASTESAANALQRVHYTHDALIDVILEHPMASQGELAKMFGYTETWISRIMCSDVFQARLAARKTELVDPSIRLTLEERITSLAHKSLTVLEEKMKVTSAVPMDTAVRTLELATKALGFGARDKGPVVNNNFVVALPPKAESEQKWVEGVQARQTALPSFPTTTVTDVVPKP